MVPGARDGPLDELAAFGGYLRALPGFFRRPLGPDEARARIRDQLRRREETFLTLIEGAVYGNPSSPYRSLLRSSGAELGDVRALIRDRGLEPALDELRRAGVYATLDEFKGRRSLDRHGVSAALSDRDFDNPLVKRYYAARSSGSRGAPRRVVVDLARLEHDAAHHSLFKEAFGLRGRPFGAWRVIPPDRAGLQQCLFQVKTGGRVDRWFNPYRPRRNIESIKFAFFTACTMGVGRALGADLRWPEYCPPDRPARVARWLADCTAEGRSAVLDLLAGLGVRVCLAAQEDGLDISGALLRVGGEPFTEAKAAAVARTGARAVCHYSMAETGRVAVACEEQAAVDDMHFLSDKLALLQHRKPIGSSGVEVDAFSYTTLLPATSKVMINVESGDYGVLSARRCGCPYDALGLTQHVHGVRSYEKLTSGGNHFLGSDLLELFERVLPSRFGGAATDYQLVEREDAGVPKVSVLVRQRVGPVEEEEVVATVLEFLRATRRNRLMADVWAQTGTLQVVRDEPRRTLSAKVLPLHIEGSS